MANPPGRTWTGPPPARPGLAPAAKTICCTRTGEGSRLGGSPAEGPFQVLHQFANPVVIEAGPDPQRARTNREGGYAAAFAAAVESGPEQFVDHRLEGTPRTAHFGLHGGSDVVIKCERGSHILMLKIRHQDVKIFFATSSRNRSRV